MSEQLVIATLVARFEELVRESEQLRLESETLRTDKERLSLANSLLHDELHRLKPEAKVLTYVDPRFARRLDDFPMSVRLANCLDSEQLYYVGDLAKCTEARLLRVKNFGRKALKEAKELLASIGLSLGMTPEYK